MNPSPATGSELLYRVGWNLCSSVFDSLFRIEGYEAHFVPRTGAFLLAANHVSYLDPPAVGVCFRRPIHYFARDTLFRGPADRILRGVNAVPVNNRGGQDLGAIRGALDVLRSGGGLLVFPEGTRSPDGNFLPPRRGIGLLACKGGVPVVPARIFGTFEALGRNREPRWGQPIRVRFGKPLPAAEFDPGRKAKDRFDLASETIMAAIRGIPAPAPPKAV
ncbi:MAG: lysophospholipid acyltransferase family protein [Puniceicoccaceae bacterium]